MVLTGMMTFVTPVRFSMCRFDVATASETRQSAWQRPLLLSLLLGLLQFLGTAVFLHVPQLSALLAQMRQV